MSEANLIPAQEPPIGLFPIIQPVPPELRSTYQRVVRFSEPRYWRAASTSALRDVLESRLRYGLAVADGMWTPKMLRILKSPANFDAFLHCPKAGLVKAGLCLKRVATPDEFKGTVALAINEGELAAVMGEVTAIADAFDYNSPDYFARMAHLFAAGALATTKSIAGNEWRRFGPRFEISE